MKRIPFIKSVMTPFPYSIGIDAPISHAEGMMNEHDIHHLPVIEGDKLVSVISNREVALAMSPAVGSNEQSLSVRDICSCKAYVVELMEPLDRVLLHMARKHLDSAIVVKDDKLVGIFTITDACRCFGQMLRSLFPSGSDDAA